MYQDELILHVNDAAGAGVGTLSGTGGGDGGGPLPLPQQQSDSLALVQNREPFEDYPFATPFLVLCGVSAPLMLVGMAWVIKERRRFPLSGRSISLLVPIGVRFAFFFLQFFVFLLLF